MSWTRRSAGLLGAAAMVMSVVACTAADSAVDCAASVFTYQDRSYVGVPDAIFTPGKKLGVATTPTCEDTGTQDGSEEPLTTETAYEVDGISPGVAIALYGDTPETATLFAVDSGSGLPREVRKLIDGS